MSPTTFLRRLPTLAAATVLLVASSRATAANLIINGEFTQGALGFTSDYVQSVNLTGETRYAVGSDPHTFHSAALSFGDHTTGTGQMLIANGATSPGIVAWRQTLPVLAHSAYDFTAYACSWGSDGTGNDQSPATLKFLVNGQQLGSTLTLPKLDALYVSLTAAWDSGTNTLATLEIVDTNSSAVGNDFILDDLAFIGPAIPEPATGSLAILIATAAITVRPSNSTCRRPAN